MMFQDSQISLFEMMNHIEEAPKIVQENELISEERLFENEEVLLSYKEDEEHYVGEQVTVTYDGLLYTARVTRIYNDGNTINCVFDGKSTAFHKSLVYS